MSSAINSAVDRGYYVEMRDRSGFDFDGKGQNDRGPIGFDAGALLVWTDETHAYGNSGTDDPPAQSPLDAHPQAGSGPQPQRRCVQGGEVLLRLQGVDNYTDPASESGNWEFRYNCLSFEVTSMSGGARARWAPTAT